MYSARLKQIIGSLKKKTHTSNNICIEEDPLDIREAPVDACYGVHTLRAVGSFYISDSKINDIPELVRGMIVVRKAAAMVDKELQATPKSVADVIIAVCDEVLNNGRCMDQFPVDVYQGGAGTSINVNTNEVLANTGLELMGHQRDEHQHLNPNNHINKHQSTNDVYPTGLRIAVYSSLIKLVDVINQLRGGSERRAAEFRDILKMGYTQLQGAVPMILGQRFCTFSILLKEEAKNTRHTAELLLEINLGVTAIDTGLNTSKEYSLLAVKKLAEVAGFSCTPAEDLIEITSDCDTYVMVHGTLKHLAVKMSRICNDLRLPSSGPRASLNEINLPELQAGFSIMPTKIDPVVSGAADQVRFEVADNDAAAIMAAEAGQLQLNAIEPVIGRAMFESVHVLTGACYSLLEKCTNGTTASKEVCEGYVYSSIDTVTHLNPLVGHHNDDIVDKICAKTGRNVREVVLERGLLTEVEPDDIFPAQGLMHPVYKTKRYINESEQ